MLSLRAVAKGGPVLLPSFTFSASAHAVMWNGMTPVFVECVPGSMQVDVDDMARRLNETEGASALLATHVFGAPCDAELVEASGRAAGIPVVFDAAHGFGARRGDRSVGTLGDVEVFSMSPTKVVVAGEGGLVATNRADVAAFVRLGRDYGNPGDYDTQFVGLNARLSEMHAAVALESLAGIDDHLATRRRLAARYRAGLAGVVGIEPQVVDDGDLSTYKDFTVRVVDGFGLDRDGLVRVLGAEGVQTRNYFSPAVHQQRAYAQIEADLPTTALVASQVVSLPMHGLLGEDEVDAVVELVAEAQLHSAEVSQAAAIAV
jgi:dTDP-4-amino-4,6-dideoxygalactose transaminase